MEKIVSLTNSKVKKWVSLQKKKNRDDLNLFLVEGEHLIEEAIKRGCVETIITDDTCPFEFEEVYEVTPQIMKKISTHTSGEHFIAVCRKMDQDVKDAKRVVILDGIQDPGNLGTIIRSAVSFGFDAIYASKDTCDLYNEKVIRSTQGALFDIPMIYASIVDVIKELKKDDFCVYSFALKNATAFKDLKEKEKMAFVFGNEGSGIRKEVLEVSDETIKIEMNHFESLNVAVACGIVLYQFQK